MKQKYIPMVSETDKPAIHLNTEIQNEFRVPLKKYYYDESRYDSYLEQLGIKYPTLKPKTPEK
jgi:aminobenzoyl-glutamate utilization protein B